MPILGLKTYFYIAIALAFVGMAIGLKVQTVRLEASKAETVAVQGRFDAFVSQAKALGEAQEAKTKEIIATQQKAKEVADRENAKNRTNLDGVYAAYRSLRDQRSGANSSLLPAAAAGSASPERACFQRATLDSAISSLDRGTTRILEKGDVALVNLNTAKAWASSLP